MFYLIHENPIRDSHHKKLVEQMGKMGLQYELFQYEPFDVDIAFSTDRKDVWVFGTFTIAHIANKYGFHPGSMYNANHDFEVYAPKYGTHMLNHDALVLDFTDPLPEDKKWDMFFARPCGDTKAFTGQVFMRHSWESYVQQQVDNDKLRYIKDSPGKIRVLISPLKEIESETRCWIIGGKVATMSEYKKGRQVIGTNKDHDLVLKEQVQRLVDIYRPAEAFVLDVCNLQNSAEIKIVEINCMNCSGFYEADMELLLKGLENHFNK